MKKILFLISIIFLLTGCYDYIEVDNLSFISSIAIDYDIDNNSFLVSYEVLKASKEGGAVKNEKSNIISAKGKNISDAFDNASLKVDNVPYFYHLKIIVISKEIANNYVKELLDYILRNPDVKNEFFLCITQNTKAIDLIKQTTEKDPDMGKKLFQMIKNNKYQNNITIDQNFETTLKYFLNDNLSALLNTFKIKDDNIIQAGVAAFKGYKLQKIFTEEESALFNLINQKDCNLLLTNYYDNDLLTINLYESNTDIKIKNNEIFLNVTALGEIKNNTTNFDLIDEEVYKKLNIDFSNNLNKKLTYFIDELKKEDIDLLKVNETYYQKTGKKYNIFNLYDIKINSNVQIDKKGLIFNIDYK